MFDERMEALARNQHGLITLRQATELGISRGTLRYRRRTGALKQVRPAVFRLPGAPDSPQLDIMAAVLTGGPSAVLSHSSAAALHGLPGFSMRPYVVSVHRHGRRPGSGIRFEQSLALLPRHVRLVDGIPCTSVARTLFDLCGDPSVRPGRAARALDTALGRKMVTVPALWRVLDELAERGRRGTVWLRTLLTERDEGFVAPESELEARFVALVEKFGLPAPERQVDLGDSDQWIGRVDFLWRAALLVVEVDGAAFHDGFADRRHDAERDALLAASGWTVLRFRWADVVDSPASVAASIRNRCSNVS
jgi:predicted transcriptional regulator of viral defense system